MAAPSRRSSDRPRLHPKLGPGRVVACRLKSPDAARLAAVLNARGIGISDWLRTVALDALDAADGTPGGSVCTAVSLPSSLAV